MFLDQNTKPDKDIYYLGAKLIEMFQKTEKSEIDFFTFFQKFNRKEKISISLYVLTIDWLFLIGVIKKGKKGYIKKCL